MQNKTPKESWSILEEDMTSVIIDVRTPEEWKGGLVGSDKLRLLTITSNFEDFIHGLRHIVPDESTPILFICKGGARSANAGMFANKAGYSNCYNVVGGFIAWQDAQLPQKNWNVK